MTTAQRFIDMKTRIGGNRERREFDFTFGTPMETRSAITMPAAHIRRIISELDFAIKLSEELGGRYDGAVDAALSTLEQSLDEDGVVTKRAAADAEAALMPMSEAAKEYEILCAAHAHIDMNWMWSWQETVAATLATFRTMLNLMKEYPDFTFSQSQASVYAIVEEFDPDMMAEIKARIAEGRWEVTASAWVETDKNMPDTESLLRHIKLTREYLTNTWGVPGDSLNIDFSPDTFGHSQFIPEIDLFGGVKYMYHCRGLTTRDVIYRWRAPSGAELLVYREPFWYNSGITPDIGTGIIDISHCSGGLKTGLIVYGVGDHGGGATRRDVERILEMAQWPVFPQVRFGTFGEYFQKAEAVRENLTLRTDELNAIFTGCYTTQSRIKRANRRTEAALMDAETLSAMAGTQLPKARYDKAWRNVLFTHFHDILTGSCVQESREHAIGLFADAMAIANTASSNAITRIGEHIDTSVYTMRDAEGSQSEGAGVGYGIEAYAGVPNPERGRGKTRVYTVYNPCETARDEVVEVTVWDWPFDMSRIEVKDANGNALPFALLTPVQEKYWDHLKLRLAVRISVPAYGYNTLCVTEGEAQSYPTYRLEDTRTEKIHDYITLENEFVRAVFCRMSGALISFIDKASGKELIKQGTVGAVWLISTEASSSNAWNIGRWTKVSPMDDTIELKPFANDVVSGFTLKQRVLGSTVETRVTLPVSAKALEYKFDVDWNEAGRGEGPIPVLAFVAPVGSASDKTLMDVPAGVITREAKPQDLPALTFAAVCDGDRAVYMSSDSKYGYRHFGDELSVTLINTANSPDPYPERGIHHITVWLGADSADPKALKDAARLHNHPAVVCSTGIHEGALPAAGGMLFAFESAHSVVTSLTRDGDCVKARICNLSDNEDDIKLAIPGATAAIITDLEGAKRGDAAITGGKVCCAVPAYSLIQIEAAI